MVFIQPVPAASNLGKLSARALPKDPGEPAQHPGDCLFVTAKCLIDSSTSASTVLPMK